MGRAIFEDLSVVPVWKADLDPSRVPDLAELIEGLTARESVWEDRLAEVRAHSELQAAVFAAREAARAARETALISRLEQRGRVIDELTMFLSEMTSLRQEEAQALEETQRALRVAKTRLAKARRAAKPLGMRRVKKVGDVRDPDSAPVD